MFKIDNPHCFILAFVHGSNITVIKLYPHLCKIFKMRVKRRVIYTDFRISSIYLSLARIPLALVNFCLGIVKFSFIVMCSSSVISRYFVCDFSSVEFFANLNWNSYSLLWVCFWANYENFSIAYIQRDILLDQQFYEVNQVII